MKITRNLQVPTGNILVVEGELGNLELVSLGDYGKEKNLIADHMGLDRPIEHVAHQEMLPLTEKWVITISTQYGCSMGCKFCSVPKVGPGKNATMADLENQILAGMSLHPEVTWSNRLNVHFARMGEPTFNQSVIDFSRGWLASLRDGFHVHPVVSTMMPRGNKSLANFLIQWMHVKNDVYEGNAGLQLSINSTDTLEREKMFGGDALSLREMSTIVGGLPKPRGRKITLNFAVAGYTIDPEVLLGIFSPEHHIIKLTPMHKTPEAVANGIMTEGDYTSMYPYKSHEEALKAAGYDVLVFIASEEEDLGLITCGNAILSGSTPMLPKEQWREV